MHPKLHRPKAAGTPTRLHRPYAIWPPAWAVTQMRRVLRILEGFGPQADRRVERALREARERFLEAPTRSPGPNPAIRDQCWGALLRAQLFDAARFFRPFAVRREPLVWVQRPDGGADPLARKRVAALVDRLCLDLPEEGLDPARIRQHCARRLRSGIDEPELARILALTSTGEAVVLRRMATGAGSASPLPG